MSKREVKTLDTGLLVRELRDVEWDTLGRCLGLSKGEIKEIEGNYQNTGRRRIEMFDKWLSKEENPSWEKMIAALEDMSENNIASQLRKKYVYQQQPRDESQIHQPKVTDDQQATERVVLMVDKQDQVARELDNLEERYLQLVIDARSTMEAANLSVIQLESFSQYYINEEVTTVKELFRLLQPFCFLDYSLLEKAIKIFIDPAHKVVNDLSKYVEQLTNFKKSTTLRGFMLSIENAQKSLTTKQETGACTVTLRLVGGWLSKTMDDLDKLLKEIFQDKSSVLAHIRIIKGSIVVTYLAPQSEADSLVKLAQTKLSFMPQVGVCGLDIGQRTVISEVTAHNFSFQFSLIKAVVDNNINLLTFLININISPDATNDQGETALLHGSYYGREKAVSILLQANANPNLQTDDDATPIFMAAQEGHSDIVSILLQANANPDLQKDDGATPIFMAAQKGHSDIVSILLQANANPDLQTDSGATPIFMAAQEGHSDIVSILLQANANLNLQKDSGATPIFMAAQEGHSDIVSIFLQANANLNLQKDDGATPIFMAAQEGHSDIVSILLQANANPDLAMDDGTTPLSMAAQKGHSDIVSILLQATANPDLQTDDGTTPLFMAAQEGHSDIVSILLQANANPDLQKDDGATPIFMAAQEGHSDIVSILLQANANLNLQKDDGATPIFMAAQEGHSDIVSILLQANANPNLPKDNGSTSLMIACYNCYPKIVQLLLTSGAYPNLKFSNGSTALMFACRSGCLDSTELLLMSGADPSIVGPEGLIALDMAASSGHDDIVDLIQAVQLSQSSTTSPVLTATEISTSIDNKTMAIVNKAMEDMIVAKTESYISTYYKKLKKTLPLKSDQEELQTIV